MMLVAYDGSGRVIAFLSHLTARGATGKVIGLVDFAAHEENGGLLEVWNVHGAKGSGTWPEYLGARAHEFKVERENDRITALVHNTGHRRNRATIEKAIAERIKVAGDKPADIRDLVGGPGKPLGLDARGRTVHAAVERRGLRVIDSGKGQSRPMAGRGGPG